MAGTLIFYSGAEPKDYWELVRRGAPRSLASYWYIRQNDPDFLRRRHAEAPDMHFMVDSGAHTLQKEEGSNWTEVQWEGYLEEYAAWIRKNSHLIFAVVELDVSEQVGYTAIFRWRRKYFEPLEADGIPVIYVWHTDSTPEEFAADCRRYRYVGLTAAVYKDRSLVRKLSIARKYRTRVHGFAITSYRAMRDLSLFTADSTTWLARGTQYGDWCIWDGRRMFSIPTKADRPKYRAHIESLGFDFASMCKEDWRENCRFCLNEFRRMEDHYIRVKSYPGYWEPRLPYPEVLAKMPRESLDAWAKYLGIAETGNPLPSLRAVSCVQNSRLAEYRDTPSHGEVVSGLLDGQLTQVDSEEELDKLRDVLNGVLCPKKEAILKRGEDDDVFIPQIREEGDDDNEGADGEEAEDGDGGDGAGVDVPDDERDLLAAGGAAPGDEDRP